MAGKSEKFLGQNNKDGKSFGYTLWTLLRYAGCLSQMNVRVAVLTVESLWLSGIV